jgi:hypothetical protein
MMPEAIAIVLSPTDAKKGWALFRLTDAPGSSGLELILRCEVLARLPLRLSL